MSMMHLRRCLIAAAAAVILLACPAGILTAEHPALSQWSDFSKKTESKKLSGWLRCRALAHMTGSVCSERLDIRVPPYFGSLGLFVTLKKGRDVRGCYGAFSHSSADISTVLHDYLVGAMTRDPRHQPLDISELMRTEIILTVTSAPHSVSELDSVDLHRSGVMIVCAGGETSVFVPAEIRNTASIERCISNRICQIYVFAAVTIR